MERRFLTVFSKVEHRLHVSKLVNHKDKAHHFEIANVLDLLRKSNPIIVDKYAKMILLLTFLTNLLEIIARRLLNKAMKMVTTLISNNITQELTTVFFNQ